MLRQLCRCADCQGPPISAVGSPQPPPYARSPSPEFHTPPIEVHLIEDAKTPPPQTSPLLVPPHAPQSPIPFSNAENIPLACCANPPAPRASLQPIDEVVRDAEDSDVVVERLEDRIGEENTLSFLTQGRGACHRAGVVSLVTLLHILTACNQEITPGPGPLNLRENDSNDKETVAMIWEEGVINAPPRSLTPAARTVSFSMDHQLEPVIRTLQAARLRDQEPMFWLMQGSISADSFSYYRLDLAVDSTEEEGD